MTYDEEKNLMRVERRGPVSLQEAVDLAIAAEIRQASLDLGEFALRGERYADALIEIAAAFYPEGQFDELWQAACCWCDAYMFEGCSSGCAGLLARRALGVG